jgi:hypothetical protein
MTRTATGEWDAQVGRLIDPIGMYGDEVFLRDLSQWHRKVLAQAIARVKAKCRKDPAPGHLDGCPGDCKQHAPDCGMNLLPMFGGQRCTCGIKEGTNVR